MKDWRDWLMVGVLLLSVAADYNAREAHRHTHEIACKIGLTELCKSHD